MGFLNSCQTALSDSSFRRHVKGSLENGRHRRQPVAHPIFQPACWHKGHGIIPRSEEEKDVTILIERQELIGGREDRFCGQLEEVIEELLVLQNVGPVTPACHVTSQELFKGV